jgi:hypothetical protein
MNFQPFLKEKGSFFSQSYGFCFPIMLDDTYDKQFFYYSNIGLGLLLQRLILDGPRL